MLDSLGSGRDAMEPVNSRMSRLKNQIRDQIEDVAKSICEGGNAFEAMQMLESLTSEFIAEKHRLSNNRKPVEDRPALEQMSMPSALHCPINPSIHKCTVRRRI